ncbi:MAG: alpha/beta hydrolase family protein [Bacteroidota bacterium]
MIKSIVLFINCFLVAGLNLALFSQELTVENLPGNWSGEMEVSGSKLELIFKVQKSENNKLSASLDVPAQGAYNLPVKNVEMMNDSVFFHVEMIMGRYSGKMANDTTISGTWKQGGVDFQLTLTKTENTSELKRPQTPWPPFPYSSEEVEYLNPVSGLKLAGTLTIPENADDSPAAILITGSGAQDRDETIFGHKPFWVIADYLTRNGMAVLRVDDRGVGGSEGNVNDATSEDFSSDVVAGQDFLKGRNEIDPAKIGLIGHSEGGLVAPMVASRSEDVAFIVLLAGPGVPGEEILYEQIKLINQAAGVSEEQLEQNLKTQKAIFEIVRTEEDSVKRLDRLQRTFSNGMYPMMQAEQKKAIDMQLQSVNNTWFRYFLSYNPRPALRRVKCPVLALNGEKDLQVPPKQNLPAIEKALTEGGNPNFKTMELDNLNHLFQHCETGAISEYGQIEETISPEVLEIMTEWIWEVVDEGK